VLISVSLLASCARYARDKLAAMQPSALRLRTLDVVQIAAHIVAYAANILATPTEDQMAYEASRQPEFWRDGLGAFQQRLQLWHALNVLRLAACALGWLLLVHRLSPAVLHRELVRDQAMLAAGRELGVLGARGG
jgi:hypothetical protein